MLLASLPPSMTYNAAEGRQLSGQGEILGTHVLPMKQIAPPAPREIACGASTMIQFHQTTAEQYCQE